MASSIQLFAADPKEALLLSEARIFEGELTEAFLQSLATRSNFVLKSDAVFDLGGPDRSAVFLKYETDNDQDFAAAVVEDDASDALGLYVRVSGEALNDELFYLILQNFRAYLRVSGVMVKGADDELWLRLSKKSPLRSEQALLTLAKVLSLRLKKEFPEIQSTGIVFIRGEGDAFALVDKSARSFFKKAENLKARVWEQRGFNFNECHVLGHCGKCKDKKLCANVRRINRLTDAQRDTETPASCDAAESVAEACPACAQN